MSAARPPPARRERDEVPARIGRLLEEIERADHLARIYPAGHPQPAASCERAASQLRELTAVAGAIDLLVSRGTLSYGGAVVHENRAPGKSLAIRLHDAGLRAVRFGAAFEKSGLERFLAALRAACDAPDDEGLLFSILWEEDIPGLAFVGADSEDDEVDAAVDETLALAAGRLANVIEALGRESSASQVEPSDAPGAVREPPRLDGPRRPQSPDPRKAVAEPRGPAALLAPEVVARLGALTARHASHDPIPGLIRIVARILPMPEVVTVAERLGQLLSQAILDLAARGQMREAVSGLTRIRAAVSEVGSLGPAQKVLDLLLERLVSPQAVTIIAAAPPQEAQGFLEMLDARAIDALAPSATREQAPLLAKLMARFWSAKPKELFRYLDAKSASVSVAAADAITRLKPSLEGVDPRAVVRAAPLDARPAVLAALTTLDAGSTAPFLTTWIDDPDEELRRAALRELSARRSAPSYPKLAERFQDPSFRTRADDEQLFLAIALLKAGEGPACAAVESLLSAPPLVFGRAEWARAAASVLRAIEHVGTPGTRNVLERITRRGGPAAELAKEVLEPPAQMAAPPKKGAEVRK